MIPKKLIGPWWMWLTAAQVAWLTGQHWRSIPVDHRRRVGELVRKSHANPRHLSPAERHELREIAREMEWPTLARRSAGIVVFSRRLREKN